MAGCSSRSKGPDFARTDDKGVLAASQPVNLLDKDLEDRVAADIADSQRLPDGRLRVRVNLRNSSKKALRVEARCVFKDDMGLSIGDETEWQPIFFAPQQIQTYDATSREPSVRKFTVEVRKP